jgi:predicted dehydrogenase
VNKLNRRDFIKSSIIAGASMAITAPFSKVLGANEDIQIAVIGTGSQGGEHCRWWSRMKGVRLAAVCDADISRANNIQKTNPGVKVYQDLRKLLEDKDIDAISSATPNHWHALVTVWACQAGKDVYIEKPVSHSIRQGRKMVEAARKYNRIVQAGTQQRSCPAVKEAARDIQAGKYGKVLWVHCCKLSTENRASIGKVTEGQPVPDNIDYNLWAGPAPMTPVMRKSFHYDWHWQWSWGDGEMANWGNHYIDDVRHLLGWDSVPTKVVAAGNRFLWDDNGQTPNMHLTLFDYNGLPVVVDIRNLPDAKRPGGKAGALYLQSRGGNIVQCENASISLSRGGGAAYDKDGNKIYQYKGDGGSGHPQNFIDAVRSRRRQDLAAEIEVGHLSTTMCHLANISWRIGSKASVDQVRQAMKSHEDAVNTLDDILEQLKGNDVDLNKEPFILGPALTYDRKQERFVTENAEQANKLVNYTYREPFVIPDAV